MSVINTDYQNYIHNAVVNICNRELNLSPTMNDYPLNSIINNTFQSKPKLLNVSSEEYNKHLTILIINECITYLKSRNGSTGNNFQGIESMPSSLQPVSTSIHNQSSGLIQPQFQSPIQEQMHEDPKTLLNQKINERADLDQRMHSTSSLPNLNLQVKTGKNLKPENISNPNNPNNDLSKQVLQYLSMTSTEQETFSINNPSLFDEIQKILKQSLRSENETNKDITNMNMNMNTNPKISYQDFLKKKLQNNSPKNNASEIKIDTMNQSIDDSNPNNNIKTNSNTIPSGTINTELLDLDFRRDLIDLTENKFKLSHLDYHNVKSMKLESCILGNHYLLNNEPYLYLCIDELNNNYVIGKNRISLFGKLLLERSVNGFNIYKPENCQKVFEQLTFLNGLTVSFFDHQMQKIYLQKMNVRKVCKYEKSNKYELVFNTDHYLTVNDCLNSIDISNPDRIQVTKVLIDTITDSNKLVINQSIVLNKNIQFEKTCIKCVLTFIIKCEL